MTEPFRVEIANLTKTFSGRNVLHLDNLVLESGQSYALIGSNGSGKSTLLRALAGTLEKDTGSITVVRNQEQCQVSVGYMPQKSYVFGFSVSRNVAMAIPPGTCNKDEIAHRVEQALAAVNMTDLAHAGGNTLSGGEAQRVALARILVRDLDVVLLDEPTASMDIEGTLQVEEALAQYRERTNCLLVVATHAPAQARRIANKALMLAEGKIVEQGPIEEVLSQPQSEEGKAFLSYWQL